MMRKLAFLAIAAGLACAAWLSTPRDDGQSTAAPDLPRRPPVGAGGPGVEPRNTQPPDRAALVAPIHHRGPSEVPAADVVPPPPAKSAASLIVRLNGLRPDGTLRLAVFQSAQGFPEQERATQRFTVEPADAKGDLVIEDLPETTIAVAIYQDLNRDGVLNKGTYGVPTEPYGFSNNARGAFGPPSFESASFRFPAERQEVEIELR